MRQLKITKQVTNRDTKSLDKYLHDISKESLLSIEEEFELARCVREGDEVALNKLVRANLRFVVSVSKQYQNQGLSLGDLINEGNLGLIKAAKRFDPTKGFKFISYAVWWCRQSIMQAIAENSRLVRLPMNKCSILSKVSKVSAKLEQKFERAPLPIEISEELNLNEDEVKESIKNSGRYTSLDAPLVEGEDSNLYDVLSSEESTRPDKVLLQESLRVDICSLIKNISKRERNIIEKCFGLDGKPQRTLEEIGQEHDLTRERVRQIKDKACKKLRNSSKSWILKSYLDIFE